MMKKKMHQNPRFSKSFYFTKIPSEQKISKPEIKNNATKKRFNQKQIYSTV